MPNLAKSLLDFLYPPRCVHCNAHLSEETFCCKGCLQLLTLIDPQDKCPYCFSNEINPPLESCCKACRTFPPLIKKMAAAFEYEGPAAVMIKKLKYGGANHLAKGLGAYLAAQILSVDWPLPDYIIPMPISRLRRFERGYNQSELLAAVVSEVIGRPVLHALERSSGEFSQAGLNHQQRLKLSSKGFSLVANADLRDKTLLLIDDVITTGSSLRCCAEALQEACPKAIYAAAVCKASLNH